MSPLHHVPHGVISLLICPILDWLNADKIIKIKIILMMQLPIIFILIGMGFAAVPGTVACNLDTSLTT